MSTSINNTSVNINGVDAIPRFGTLTIATTEWSAATLQKTGLSGVTASNCVIVGPAPASIDVWRLSGLKCTAQGAGTLTFSYVIKPTSDVSINYVVVNLGV